MPDSYLNGELVSVRIGIDARMMGAENTRGIGRYIEEMVKAMLPTLHEDETLILFEKRPNQSPIEHPKVKHIKADIPWYGLKEQLRLPKLYKEASPDILWVPHWNIPIFYNGKLVTTIHDLLLVNQKRSAKISTRNPILFHAKYLAFRLVLKAALKKSRAIFPPTQAIAEELKTVDSTLSKKLHVTGEGMGHVASENEKRTSEKYLLYVGSAYPHKRLDLALKAWQQIAKQYPDLRFFVVGESDVFMKRHEERVQLEQIPRVRFLGAVSDTDLYSYLEHAEGLLFPSEYEGFGLPPVEAILSGTPVVVSDIPVLKEVLPKTGVFFFHKGSVNDMITAIESMLERGFSEGEWHEAKDWIQHQHSWSKTAGIVLKSIRNSLIDHESHDEKEEKTRGTSAMEKDESQGRTGASA